MGSAAVDSYHEEPRRFLLMGWLGNWSPRGAGRCLMTESSKGGLQKPWFCSTCQLLWYRVPHSDLMPSTRPDSVQSGDMRTRDRLEAVLPQAPHNWNRGWESYQSSECTCHATPWHDVWCLLSIKEMWTIIANTAMTTSSIFSSTPRPWIEQLLEIKNSVI